MKIRSLRLIAASFAACFGVYLAPCSGAAAPADGKPNVLYIVLGDWKGLRTGNRWQLYDLTKDPGEARDVAGDHADIIARMQDVERRAYTPMRPGEIVDQAILTKDRTSNSVGRGGKAAGEIE